MNDVNTNEDAQARRLREAIRALVRRFSLAERADMSCCGMTVAQAATLEALSDGGLRLSDLGKRLGIAPSTLTRNLTRLEERGLIRKGARSDRRTRATGGVDRCRLRRGRRSQVSGRNLCPLGSRPLAARVDGRCLGDSRKPADCGAKLYRGLLPRRLRPPHQLIPDLCHRRTP